MPGAGTGAVARGSASRAAASAILSCRLHATSAGRRDRLPEQGCRLCDSVPCCRRDARHHRIRSQASWRQARHYHVLCSWGQTLQHHPHVHCVVPGGGPSLDDTRWVTCRPSFLLPVHVLGRLFRRLFLRELENAFNAGKLRFFTNLANLAEPPAFARRLRELRRLDWVVYAKPAFVGPEQVLAYLGRYTHRVAIANSRLLSLADGKIRFTWKDYRANGTTKVMTLDADEFIRRFLLHALPEGFRHYGFLANGSRGDSLALCRRLLEARATSAVHQPADNHIQGDRPFTAADFAICPDCGGTMRRIAAVPRSCNAAPFSCDTS